MSTQFTTRLSRSAVERPPERGFPWLMLVLDIGLMLLAAVTALGLLDRWPTPVGWSVIATMIVGRMLLLLATGSYRAVLRFTGLHTALTVAGCLVAGSAFGVVAGFIVLDRLAGGLGRAYIVLELMLAIAACTGVRVLVRMLAERRLHLRGVERPARALIVGAGRLGESVLREMLRSGSYQPIGFLDDQRPRGMRIHGRPILGRTAHVRVLGRRHEADVVVVAVPDPPVELVRRLFAWCVRAGLRVKLVRGLEVGQSVPTMGDLALEDLLRRPPRHLDSALVRGMIAGKTVLVTGAGGSIGTELCRQIARLGASRLVMIDASEVALYQVDMALRDAFAGLNFVPILDRLNDVRRLRAVLDTHQPVAIFHAAAYKHVPLCEENPFAAVSNNVGSFRTVLMAATGSSVERIVLISTDKAVRPTNVMGASKRVCELLLQLYAGRPGVPILCAVRFGNVLGSSGSVVPRFLEQIRSGGPVTVTDRRMTRFFMLIPEAVELVLHAGSLATGGEVFILDMGHPIRIDDMARQLILMTGHVPDRDIAVRYTGLRPGEKLYEEVLRDEAESATAIQGILVARTVIRVQPAVEQVIDRLLQAGDGDDLESIAQYLATLVPDWSPSAKFVGVHESSTQRLERVIEPSPAQAE